MSSTIRPVKRGELGTLLIGFAIAVALVVAIGVWAHVLAGSDYSNGGSNLLGIIGTVPLIAALAVAAWTRWHRTCAVPHCLRIGEHPVDGTLQKVCNHHHTLEHQTWSTTSTMPSTPPRAGSTWVSPTTGRRAEFLLRHGGRHAELHARHGVPAAAFSPAVPCELNTNAIHG